MYVCVCVCVCVSKENGREEIYKISYEKISHRKEED